MLILAMQIIPFSITDDGVKYYDPFVYRLPGEWIIINCRYHGRYVRNFLFSPTGSTAKFYVYVDNEKIKVVSENLYNITSLANNDSGRYKCRLWWTNTSGEIIAHQLIVLQKGIT